MSVNPVIQVMNRLVVSLEAIGRVMVIPMQNEGTFSAVMVDGGVVVSSLGSQPFLPWEAFTETVSLLIREGGSVQKGSAKGNRLGSDALPLRSVEGHIAHTVYGKQEGDVVFPRAAAIADILAWSGICVNEPERLRLADAWQYLIRDAV
jgi:hypothetical protein